MYSLCSFYSFENTVTKHWTKSSLILSVRPCDVKRKHQRTVTEDEERTEGINYKMIVLSLNTDVE